MVNSNEKDDIIFSFLIQNKIYCAVLKNNMYCLVQTAIFVHLKPYSTDNGNEKKFLRLCSPDFKLVKKGKKNSHYSPIDQQTCTNINFFVI